jgi:hypothetical protein
VVGRRRVQHSERLRGSKSAEIGDASQAAAGGAQVAARGFNQLECGQARSVTALSWPFPSQPHYPSVN